MNQERMYELNINQTAQLIAATAGTNRTVMVQGHIGSGKSSLLNILGEKFPNHIKVYFDCSTKDLMDLGVPKVVTHENGNEYVTFPTNEELGLHLDKPVILMFDEWGKNKGIKLATLRVMLERTLGTRKLHPDSIVFATTNLGRENVGDMIEPHARNRITVVRMRKSTVPEWINDFAINAGVHHTLIAWAMETPQIFQSFEDFDAKADDSAGGNPYPYHPDRLAQGAFVTHRSMAAASDYIHRMHMMDDVTFQASLVGTLGLRAASDLRSYINMSAELPTLDEIKESPKTAKIPASAAAVCMVVARTMATLDRTWANAWMDYLVRLDPESQGMFVIGVRHEKYKHREVVMTNKKYTEYCLKNQHLFNADKV